MKINDPITKYQAGDLMKIIPEWKIELHQCQKDIDSLREKLWKITKSKNIEDAFWEIRLEIERILS